MSTEEAASPSAAALAEVFAELERRRQAGERIVFTNGCFDLLHPGHVASLRRARRQGDCLVVAVNDDRSVRALKGPGRPIVPLEERLALLRALRAVDYALPFEGPSPAQLIARLRPHVYVKGADWRARGLPEAAALAASGTRIVYIDLVRGYSTSALVERIRALGLEGRDDAR